MTQLFTQAPTTDFTSTTLNGSINDSVTTVTVQSASAIQVPSYIVVDREDGNGSATPNSREVMYVSAKNSNDLTVARGVNNSTARSHNSGALVEPMLTVGQWADNYSSLTAEHNTDGTHKETALDSIITGTEAQGDVIYHNGTVWSRLAAGTNTHFLQTQGAGANPQWAQGLLFSKIITATIDISTTGAVAYTGVGFQPTAILCIAGLDNDTQFSIGWSDSAGAEQCIHKIQGGNYRTSSAAAYLTIVSLTGAANESFTVVTSYDSDGFTLTKTKAGSPTGTQSLTFICFR